MAKNTPNDSESASLSTAIELADCLPDSAAWNLLLQREPQTLLQLATKRLASVAADDLGATLRIYSQALAACGQIEQALEIACQAEASASPDGGHEHLSAQLFLADVLQRQGKHEAYRKVLQSAFAAARQQGHFDCRPWLPDMIARLCAAALAAGIESNYVRQLIRQHDLVAEGPQALDWPWSLRIYTLGRFSIAKDGTQLTFPGKSPRKPLELLQALIALGGREVHTNLLINAVWPDDDKLGLRKLFDNTLHRLRRVLDYDDALLLSDGKLTLNSHRCWVDAWAFDRMVRQHLNGEVPTGDMAGLTLQLYQGHFLEREAEHPWLIRARDSLRSRFQRFVRTIGARLEENGRWQAAAEIYERGLEVDNLAEGFYRRLMICHKQCGEHAEALRVYRRCRELLSIVLGVAPSPATERVHRDLEQIAV